jgi:hypothetical protein
MDSSREMFGFFLHPAEADGLGGGEKLVDKYSRQL